MFRFAYNYFLYGLLLIPVFVALFWWLTGWRKRALRKYGEPQVIGQLIPDSSKQRRVLKFILLMAAFTFVVLALADPQIGSKMEKTKRKGIDIMIALDVSNSMLSQDIEPSRLARAKQTVSRIIGELDNDRIGIVVFAGRAYTQLPITTDFGAARLFLSNISPDLIPTQGTAIGEAIDVAAAAFDNPKRSRIILVITDGENHEDDAVKAAKTAGSHGIIVHTIGMGSPEGGPIPVSSGNMKMGFKKDIAGNTVVSKLDEATLQQIAAAGKGIYVRANNTQAALDRIFGEVNKMDKSVYDSKLYSEYEDRFQYFVALSLIALGLELLISEKKSKLLNRIRLFRK